MNFHRPIDQGESFVSCLVCGGLWRWDEDRPEPVSFTGEYPTQCTGNTNQCHHYPGECPEALVRDCSLGECNCWLCDS